MNIIESINYGVNLGAKFGVGLGVATFVGGFYALSSGSLFKTIKDIFSRESNSTTSPSVGSDVLNAVSSCIYTGTIVGAGIGGTVGLVTECANRVFNFCLLKCIELNKNA